MPPFEDRLSKYVVATLFEKYTRVEVGSDLLPDAFRADVLLIPTEPLPLDIPGAGLLARLTHDTRCLVEAFSGTVHENRLEGTLAKLRLSLYRAHQDKLGVLPARGTLWLLVTYWPQQALDTILAEQGELLEPGLLRWRGFQRETVYMVNTCELELRDETVLFKLFSKGRHRKATVTKIFKEYLEPYVTILNDFDLRFKEMVETHKLPPIDPETLHDLQELSDTRQEVLLALGREEGQLHARLEIAKRMLEEGMPVNKVAMLTNLSESALQKLL